MAQITLFHEILNQMEQFREIMNQEFQHIRDVFAESNKRLEQLVMSQYPPPQQPQAEVQIPIVEEIVPMVENVNEFPLGVEITMDGINSFPLNFNTDKFEPYYKLDLVNETNGGDEKFVVGKISDKVAMDESRDVPFVIYALWSPQYPSLEPTYTGFSRGHFTVFNSIIGAKMDGITRPPPEPPPIKMNIRTLRTRFVLMGAGIDTVHFPKSSPSLKSNCSAQETIHGSTRGSLCSVHSHPPLATCLEMLNPDYYLTVQLPWCTISIISN